MTPFRKYYWVLIVLNDLAILTTIYLTYLHFKPELSDICNFGEQWNCEIVNKSTYSELFGIPVSILGFIAYSFFSLFCVLGLKRNMNRYLPYFLLAVAGGTAFALYLTGIETFVLKTYCLFCVIQQLIILIELGIVYHMFRLSKIHLMKKLSATLLLLVTLLTACGERDSTYDNFATCIADSGTEFFGAFWCPHCADQKELFNDSVDLLPYVECDPNGKNSEYAYCQAEGVKSYPTWHFPDGSIETGVLSLEDLSDRTSCPLPGEESVMMQ